MQIPHATDLYCRVIDGVAPADLTHILSIAEDDIIEPEGTAEDAVRIEHEFIASLEKALD